MLTEEYIIAVYCLVDEMLKKVKKTNYGNVDHVRNCLMLPLGSNLSIIDGFPIPVRI